jgi:hypothetical protein
LKIRCSPTHINFLKKLGANANALHPQDVCAALEWGPEQITLQVLSPLFTFTLAPTPMFMLMGEIMFQSGMAHDTIDVIDKWLRRAPIYPPQHGCHGYDQRLAAAGLVVARCYGLMALPCFCMD